MLWGEATLFSPSMVWHFGMCIYQYNWVTGTNEQIHCFRVHVCLWSEVTDMCEEFPPDIAAGNSNIDRWQVKPTDDPIDEMGQKVIQHGEMRMFGCTSIYKASLSPNDLMRLTVQVNCLPFLNDLHLAKWNILPFCSARSPSSSTPSNVLWNIVVQALMPAIGENGTQDVINSEGISLLIWIPTIQCS